MEHIGIHLGDDELYDAIVRGDGALRECGDLALVTKDSGTTQGKPVVAITFTAVLPDGSQRRVQCVTTYNALEMAIAALRGRYGPGGFLDTRRTGGAH